MRRGFISFLSISAFSAIIAFGCSSGTIDVLGQNNYRNIVESTYFPHILTEEIQHTPIPSVTSSPTPEQMLQPTQIIKSVETENVIPTQAPSINVNVETAVPSTTPENVSVQDTKDEQVVFLGDSITEGLSIYGFFPETQIIGINSLNTILAEEQVVPVAKINPSKLFILLGINDIWEGDSVDEFIERYRGLISDIKGNTKDCNIYVESIFPVSEFAIETNPVISNTIIDDANAKIKTMTKELGVKYIDVNSVLKDEKGNLKGEYSNDGVHIINYYYPIWTKILASYMK